MTNIVTYCTFSKYYFKNIKMETDTSEKTVKIQVNENTILQFESLFYNAGEKYPVSSEDLITEELIPKPPSYGKEFENND